MSDHESNGAIDLGSLEPIKLKYTIGGKLHYLFEASAGAKARWRSSQTRAARYQDGKMVSLGDLGDSAVVMVSGCLYTTDAKGNLRHDKLGNVHQDYRVEIEVLKAWPDRVVETLYDKVLEISGLMKDDPVRVAMLKALRRRDAPVTLARMREWVASLSQESAADYEGLRNFLKESDEERGTAKNSQSPTGSTSTAPSSSGAASTP
jgi:hypothetical protein